MSNILIGLVVVVLGVLAGWYFVGAKGNLKLPQLPPKTNVTAKPTATPAPGEDGLYRFTEEKVTGKPEPTGAIVTKGGVVEPTSAVVRNTISYTDAGFTPLTMTYKLNTTVRFVNNSTIGMWVVTAVHPAHQLLPDFNQLKSVSRGGTYDYTFTKIGTWQYHNENKPSDTAIIIVTQ